MTPTSHAPRRVNPLFVSVRRVKPPSAYSIVRFVIEATTGSVNCAEERACPEDVGDRTLMSVLNTGFRVFVRSYTRFLGAGLVLRPAT